MSPMRVMDDNPFLQVRSPFWYWLYHQPVIMAVVTVVLIIYNALFVWPLRLFRVPIRFIPPVLFKQYCYLRALANEEHTPQWNRRTLQAHASLIEQVRARCTVLEEQYPKGSDLLAERERLVTALVVEFSRHTFSEDDDLKALRDTCIDLINDVPDTLIVETIALAIEAIRRELNGVRLHDTQITAALLLCRNFMVELRNGEGKTFVTIPVMTWGAICLQALRETARQQQFTLPFQNCLSFTANDYLVRRDFSWLKAVYESMGINIAYQQTDDRSYHARRLSYSADIVLMTGIDFGFDVLRNACRAFQDPALSLSALFVLVDEADQLLLDEAATPMILSGASHTESSEFIERAWVHQIDGLVEDIFGPNRIFTVEDTEVELTLAGRIFLRILIADHHLDSWETSPRSSESLLQRMTDMCAQLLLVIPWTAARLSESDRTRLEYAKQRYGTLLTWDADAQVVRINRTTFLNRWLVDGGALPTSMHELREVRDIFTWLMQQIHFSNLTALEIAQTRAKLRKYVALIPRMLRRDFLVPSIEFLLNQMAQVLRQAPFSEAFIDGLTRLVHPDDVSDEKPLWSLPHWVVFYGIPELATRCFRCLKGIDQETAIPEAAMMRDLFMLLQTITRIPTLHYEQSPAVKELVEQNAILGALVQNFLYIPDSGRLTLAGRRIAEFLSEHCERLEMTERYEKGEVISLIETSLYAYCGMREGRDYIVDNREIVLVNQVTGRREPSKHYSRYLHPFVQAKHNLTIRESIPTLRTMTVQNLLGSVPKLIGMSGTLISEEQEVRDLYAPAGSNQPIIVNVPPSKPPQLLRMPFVICRTKAEKWHAIAQEILQTREQSPQPILVITACVKDSNDLAAVLRTWCKQADEHFPIQVLNAQSEEREEEIVTWAGQLECVTIATQMASRGTDILIPASSVAEGGLYVIVAEHHTSQRLDNQAEGRAARHGDPGKSRFFISLEDKLMQDSIDAGRLEYMMRSLENLDEGEYGLSLGVLAHTLEEGFLANQEAIKFEMRRRRKLNLDIDALVGPMRDQAHGIRDLLVTGAPKDLRDGFARLWAITSAEVAGTPALANLRTLAAQMARLVEVAPDQSGPDLAAQVKGICRFPISLSLLWSILDNYREQQTVTLESADESVALVELCYQVLWKAACEADVATVNAQWKTLVTEYHLQCAFSDIRWVGLVDYLNQNLVLGFPWECWALAESHLKSACQGTSAKPQPVEAMIRTAVLSVLERRPDVPFATGTQAYLEEQEARMTRVLGEMDDAAYVRGELCTELLTQFDTLWEEALDRVNLIEARYSRENHIAQWGELYGEINGCMRRMLSQYAHRAMETLARYEQSTTRAHRTHVARWMPVGSLGAAWFERPTQAAFCADAVPALTTGDTAVAVAENASESNAFPTDISAIDAEDSDSAPWAGVDEGETDSFADLDAETDVDDEDVNLDDNIDEDDEDDEDDIDETEDADHDGVADAEEISTLLQRLLGRSADDDAPVPSYEEPPLDSLLCDEYQPETGAPLLRWAREYAHQHGMKALCYLDLLRDEVGTIRDRALVFEAFGCKGNELAHLKSLFEQDQLTTRMKLRMTYLLSRGPIELREAMVDILLTEGVPDPAISPVDDDYSPREALHTALSQLASIREFDAAVQLFAAKRAVLGPVSSAHLDIYALIFEILSQASEVGRRDFTAAVGQPWNAWMLATLHYLLQQDTYISYSALPQFLQMSLYCDDQHIAVAMMERILLSWAYSYAHAADIFKRCHYEYEAHLLQAKYHLTVQEYENVVHEIGLIPPEHRDEEAQILRAIALVGVARCLHDHRYGTVITADALRESIAILESFDVNVNPVLPVYLSEAYYLSGAYDRILDLVAKGVPVPAHWVTGTRLVLALEQTPQLAGLPEIIEALNPGTPTEVLEVVHVVNRWVKRWRQEESAHWHDHESGTALSTLARYWQRLPEQAVSFHAAWEVGQWIRTLAQWYLDGTSPCEAQPWLELAIHLWQQGMQLTHEDSPPYRSHLTREDRLARELMEIALRDAQRQIKRLELEKMA